MMTDDAAAEIFKAKPTRLEAKGDATTRVAREMIDAEANHREAKTARLRAERLAREAAEIAAPPAPKKAPRKKAAR
jgi:hypothetical protein